MAKVIDSKCLKLISAMLIGSMLLAGCAKTEETTKKKKDKKSSKDSQKESTATVEDEDSDDSDPSETTGKDDTAENGTYHLDTILWDADIPEEFAYLEKEAVDTDEENYYSFYKEQDQKSGKYWYIYIVKEDANAFRNLYKEYFSMMDYANGDLPTRNICGYDFVEISHTVSTGDYGMRVTSYVYRHEAASMTVHITFGESGEPDDFEGWALFDGFTFELPDLGLSDPPFVFLSGEPKTEVKELDLSGYKVTPVQGHFSERVYTTSDTYSSTAAQVAASDKYLYTFENKGSIVTVYQINGEEMTKVTEIAYEESTVTVNLLDNDTVTFIPDPERTHAFILVETVDGQEKLLSCRSEVHVSPDGQLILTAPSFWANEVRLLTYDPSSKTLTSSPFTLEVDPSFERAEVTSFFFADNGIFATMRDAGAYGIERLFEFDRNGKAIREITDPTREELYVESMYDFGPDILMNNDREGTLELWNKEGQCLSRISIYELIGISPEEGGDLDYSFVKTGDQGDFLLICAYNNDGILEDLVFRIHIG